MAGWHEKVYTKHFRDNEAAFMIMKDSYYWGWRVGSSLLIRRPLPKKEKREKGENRRGWGTGKKAGDKEEGKKRGSARLT